MKPASPESAVPGRRALHPEARQAAGNLLVVGTGQLLIGLVGLGTAIVVPRLLGPESYGLWMMYRTLIMTVLGLCMLGTSEVTICFLVPRLAAGDKTGAGRLFKGVTLLRTAATVLGAVLGCGLLMATRSPLASPQIGPWLALSTISQGVQLSFLLLMITERRFVPVMLMHLLQALIIPPLAAVAYLHGAWRLVPPAVAGADAGFALLALLLARPRHIWVSGWLPWREYRPLWRFGLAVALAGVLDQLFLTAMPYTMSLLGYTHAAIGYLGLAGRVLAFVMMAGGVLGRALWPTLAILLATEGPDRAQRWQELGTRVGSAALLALLGEFCLLGPLVVPRIWGAAFRDATGPLTIGLAAGFFLWQGSQCVRLLLLLRQPSRYLLAAALLWAVGGLCFVLRTPDVIGLNAAQALLAGSAAYALAARAALGGWRAVRQVFRTYALPAAAVALAALAGRQTWTVPGLLALAALWGLAFTGLIFGLRLLRFAELRDVWRALRSRAAVPTETCLPQAGVVP